MGIPRDISSAKYSNGSSSIMQKNILVIFLHYIKKKIN